MGSAGALCIRHDVPVAGPFPRGRPYVLEAVLAGGASVDMQTVAEPLPVLVLNGDRRY